jgi:hypothetical protein
MVAMTPLIVIQLMGLIYQRKQKSSEELSRDELLAMVHKDTRVIVVYNYEERV